MRYFSANYICPISTSPIKDGVIAINDIDEIIFTSSRNENDPEKASMQFYNGVLVPGFINAHCHLELSHLKGRLTERTGIAGFVNEIKSYRKTDQEDVRINIKRALSTLESVGVVAVGDICNTIDTLDLKGKTKIRFHNFIEVFGMDNDNADNIVDHAESIKSRFNEYFPSCVSITPHSTFSLSNRLWERLSLMLRDHKKPISIHFGESRDEYQFLANHNGSLYKLFTQQGLKMDLPDKKSPIDIVKSFVPYDSKILFIHNTFVNKDEVEIIRQNFKSPHLVLCPSSNLFIENKLPDVPMIADTGVNIALGTDSYASSKSLSIFDQMMIILENFPTLKFHDVLKWATINGAKALSFEKELGSFEVGKKPGINLITNFDFTNMKPTHKSQIKKIL